MHRPRHPDRHGMHGWMHTCRCASRRVWRRWPSDATPHPAPTPNPHPGAHVVERDGGGLLDCYRLRLCLHLPPAERRHAAQRLSPALLALIPYIVHTHAFTRMHSHTPALLIPCAPRQCITLTLALTLALTLGLTLAAHRSPLTSHRSPLTAHRSPLTAHRLLTAHRSLRTTHPHRSPSPLTFTPPSRLHPHAFTLTFTPPSHFNLTLTLTLTSHPHRSPITSHRSPITDHPYAFTLTQVRSSVISTSGASTMLSATRTTPRRVCSPLRPSFSSSHAPT